jgi:glycosyltransferase involved in cell wall biosynthesis
MTGGLQEQVTNGEAWFGIGIEPSCKSVIGSQDIPWIYEDRVCKDNFLEALWEIYDMSKEEREMKGAAGRRHVTTNYSMKRFAERWEEIFAEVHEKCGSWSSRKNYKSWKLMEIK